MKRLGIFGTSGQAREASDIAKDLGFQTFYIAHDKSEHDALISPEDVVMERDITRLADVKFAIGIGDNKRRQLVAMRFERELDFVNLIHPTASFGSGQREALNSSRGLIVCAGARLSNNIRIGNFTLINLNATIAHDVDIDPFTHIAAGANISGNVHIGQGCLIGAGATVNQGGTLSKLRIGAGTVIGSGAVVVRDCEPDAVYVGVPARKLK